MTTTCGNCMKDYESETQSAKCPHGPKEVWPSCSECDEPTPYACSDCAISGKTVAVCYRDACQNNHEANHPGVFCKSCGYAHRDPRLRDPDSEVSIDFNGQRLICETYARWIAETILDGRDVHLMRLGNAMEVVKIEGARPVPDPNRLQMLPSGHTYYRGIAHACEERDCPARIAR